MSITPNQQAQKDRAMAEAMKHMEYSAVDRMRDAQLARFEKEDAITFNDERETARKVKDANGASTVE